VGPHERSWKCLMACVSNGHILRTTLMALRPCTRCPVLFTLYITSWTESCSSFGYFAQANSVQEHSEVPCVTILASAWLYTNQPSSPLVTHLGRSVLAILCELCSGRVSEAQQLPGILHCILLFLCMAIWVWQMPTNANWFMFSGVCELYIDVGHFRE
jgi:hypothetical protein